MDEVLVTVGVLAFFMQRMNVDLGRRAMKAASGTRNLFATAIMAVWKRFAVQLACFFSFPMSAALRETGCVREWICRTGKAESHRRLAVLNNLSF